MIPSMSHPGFSISAESLALTLFAAAFSCFILDDDREKWHWRAYLLTVVFVNAFFAVFGPWGFLFGVFGVALAPWVYFNTFGKRQYTLRNMLLFMLIFASMCTQIASGVAEQRAHPEWYPSTTLRKK